MTEQHEMYLWRKIVSRFWKFQSTARITRITLILPSVLTHRENNGKFGRFQETSDIESVVDRHQHLEAVNVTINVGVF